jgi:DNA-binding transcriptional ArsR family regulator
METIDPAIATSGSVSQIVYILERKPEGATIQQLAQLTQLSESTVYIRLRELYNAGYLEETRAPNVQIYRLRKTDFGQEISINHEKSHSGPEDVKK